MSYEFFQDCMTPEQIMLAKKYCLQNYVRSLKSVDHRNTPEEIKQLEIATRGQADNILWKLLRVNRTTASKSTGCFVEDSPAIQFGKNGERDLKQNTELIDLMCQKIEQKTGKKIVEKVLECGLFLSPIGLYSASPDAYFVLDDGNLVVLEIKCPYTYREDTLESVRHRMNSTRTRYRVAHTAFSVSRNGAMNVRVEKQNDHYRQIQSQLYSTNAVLAVYMVKFVDFPEIHFVERDEKYIRDLAERERIRLKIYVDENKRNSVMVSECERLKSFEGYGYNEHLIKSLARDGLYCWCGNVMCYFCQQQFEIIDKNADQILAEHNLECTKLENIAISTAAHPEYLNVHDRMHNLSESQLFNSVDCEKLAKEGFFIDQNNKLVLYCCGNEQDHDNACTKATQN
uniref:Alkaline exonuclease n=1 Tax=Phthorimaea operculella granulovirus TaxID=192584 RepID=A0A481SFQ6_9BBAC|nr:alkaline exonuclease [Phthorimaea operculella granulovirus]QBH67378.1 alkaline exonuclease [Phthorimaea operculella granulovirus]